MALELGNQYMEIADRLIAKFPVSFGHIDISKVLFLSETEKTPKKYADTRRVAYPYGFLTEYKFIITFYENNIKAMNDAQRHMLVYHELLHIDADFNKIRKHDVEDFRELVSKYGVNWDIDPNLPDILTNDVGSDGV